MKRMMLAAAVAATGFAPAIAMAQTPLNAAQRQYKRCPIEAMTRGVNLVTPICGAPPAAPEFQGAELSSASYANVLEGAVERERFASAVTTYTSCINTQVMANGSLPTETLDYAACAHQFAGEQLTEASFQWGLTCIAYEDKTGQAFDRPCFPQG